MKKILMAAAAVVALTAPARAQFAPTYPVKVPFIQAAIFVMFGKEGNSVDYNPTFKSQVGYNAKVTARAIVKGNLYLRDLIPNHRGVVHAAAWEVVVLDSDPCILGATLLGPQEAFLAKTQSGDNAGGMRIEFNKMPSPRSITQHPRYTDILHAQPPARNVVLKPDCVGRR
jgi:hypothetical protein